MTNLASGFCAYILSSDSETEPERLFLYLDLIGEPGCRTTGTMDSKHALACFDPSGSP